MVKLKDHKTNAFELGEKAYNIGAERRPPFGPDGPLGKAWLRGYDSKAKAAKRKKGII